jgi:putative IMPACT (imprinted ancient) family translation regulator
VLCTALKLWKSQVSWIYEMRNIFVVVVTVFCTQVQKSNASHNCWAFKIGDHVRCSDDGEPGGTAGRPMLSALTSSGLDHIMVVVTRYFGGIKLGTGGLVRAYGKVTTECLKDARTITIKPKVSVQLCVPFDVLGVIYPLLQVYNVEKVQERFDGNGDAGVCMDLLVELDKLENLERDVGVNSKGRASFIHLVGSYLHLCDHLVTSRSTMVLLHSLHLSP